MCRAAPKRRRLHNRTRLRRERSRRAFATAQLIMVHASVNFCLRHYVIKTAVDEILGVKPEDDDYRSRQSESTGDASSSSSAGGSNGIDIGSDDSSSGNGEEMGSCCGSWDNPQLAMACPLVGKDKRVCFGPGSKPMAVAPPPTRKGLSTMEATDLRSSIHAHLRAIARARRLACRLRVDVPLNERSDLRRAHPSIMTTHGNDVIMLDELTILLVGRRNFGRRNVLEH